MVHSVTHKDGPTALIFSRQNLEQNNAMDYMDRRSGALKGAYIAKKETADLDLIIIAMEAGVTGIWYKYASKVVGVDRFGFSAPGDIVMKELGMSAENLSEQIASM